MGSHVVEVHLAFDAGDRPAGNVYVDEEIVIRVGCRAASLHGAVLTLVIHRGESTVRINHSTIKIPCALCSGCADVVSVFLLPAPCQEAFP